jgi:hypothetical protein
MQSNFATILPQHADVSESASSAHGILGRHGLMGTMVEAVLSTQCIQQVTCTRSMNWRDGVLSRRRSAREMDGLHEFENAKGTRLSF